MTALTTAPDLTPEIESTLKDFEGFTGPLTEDVRNRAGIALSNGMNSLRSKSASIRNSGSFSDSVRTEIIEYMITALQLFFDVITVIDPSLKYQDTFQKMYGEILRGFMKDLESNPIMEDISKEDRRKMIQSAIDAINPQIKK